MFSYINCINGNIKPFTQFSKTCREIINDFLNNVKLAYFKKFSSKGKVKCQETGELCKWDELYIDHRQPNTFSVIVDRFIEVQKIDINTVDYKEIMDGVYHFADLKLIENFRKYHRDIANLRLVKKERNLRRSYQAKIKRQTKDYNHI